MFDRKIEQNLGDWKGRPHRKPLVMRGARQTGKTTLIRKFAKSFGNYIELNLEKDSIRKIFSEIKDITEVIHSIEGIANQRIVPGKTLLFLDEIQNSVSAIKLLRYFYEEAPELHVISAGSLLEVRMKTEGWSFPVGRVEFLYLYPATFEEFLAAMDENVLLQSLAECDVEHPLPSSLHEKLLGLVADYMVIGGMPEALGHFLREKSFAVVKAYHESLVSSFKEDFVKYSKASEVEYLKLVWDRVPFEIGARIAYSKIGGSNLKSKNISNAFDILHEAMLVERVLPTVQLLPPLVKKTKSAPKAICLDTGLCMYALNLNRDQLKEQLISPAYVGSLFEEFVGQELMALDFNRRDPLYFWVREEKGTSSELDYLVQMNGKLFPIEVKSGSHGSLKSLHQFLHRSSTAFGIRIYSGPLRLDDHRVTMSDGETLVYQLLSVPFYLIFRLHKIVNEALEHLVASQKSG